MVVAWFCSTDSSEWAVKIIDKAKLDQEDKDALEVEVAILQKVGEYDVAVSGLTRPPTAHSGMYKCLGCFETLTDTQLANLTTL